ncbi:radical SAM protein [Erwiniaceae bacterium L1_54_6]|nr:radical SAM protein [Erwiniaceae bacterium L1_54_6]
MLIQNLPWSYAPGETLLSNGFRLINHKDEKYIYHILSNSILKKDSKISNLLLSLNDHPNEKEFPVHTKDLKTILSLNALTRPELKDAELPVSYLAISPTMNCNLRCTYCYNFQEGEEKKIRAMKEIDKIAISKIVQTLNGMNLGSRVNLAFIGGEPLLYPRLLDKLCRYAEKLARKNSIKLTILVTTNGLNLKKRKIKELILKHDIRVSISLDGPEEWHNETRRLISGGGSFGKIKESIDDFMSYYNNPIKAARATYKLEPGRLLRTYQYLKELGFNDISTGSYEFETGDTQCIDTNNIFDELDLLGEEVTRDFISGTIIRYAWFTEVISNLYNARVKDVVCGATRNHFAFDVHGKMQACHRYLGNEDYELTLKDYYESNSSELIHEIRKHGKTIDCPKCWARSMCGGECFHVGKEFAKKSDHDARQKFICNYKRKKYEVAIKMYLELANQHPEILEKIVNPVPF